MARPKPKKTARKRSKHRNLVNLQESLSVDEIAQILEERADSAEAKKRFDEIVQGAKPGTVAAMKLVKAADSNEDEELLSTLAMRGFVEAVGSNTFAELIKEEAVKSAPPFARRQAAVRWSEPGERYKDAWMLAEFGDAVAVNGKLLSDDDVLPDRDKGYVMVTDPDDTVTSEEQITLETLAQTVAERLGVPNMRDEVLASLQMSEGFQHGVFAKVLGRTEVWLPKDQAEDERSRAVIPYRDDE